jgi:hypothetical protein
MNGGSQHRLTLVSCSHHFASPLPGHKQWPQNCFNMQGDDPGWTRTIDLLLRRQTPYPLGHRAPMLNHGIFFHMSIAEAPPPPLLKTQTLLILYDHPRGKRWPPLKLAHISFDRRTCTCRYAPTNSTKADTSMGGPCSLTDCLMFSHSCFGERGETC